MVSPPKEQLSSRRRAGPRLHRPPAAYPGAGVGIAVAAVLQGTIGARAAAADSTSAVLSEVVVTARKRAENVQDVPQNIDVYGARELQTLGISQLEDYLTLTPSISFISTGPGQQRFFIRGATDGSNPNFGSSNVSTTAYLVDDLSMSHNGHIPDLHLYDIERIEVLNGPQGTLFGAGALSGAVRVISNRPDPRQFSAGADVDGGTIDGGGSNWSVEGFANLPLVDGKTALRLSAYSVHDGGYIDNLLGTRTWLNGVTSTNAAWAGQHSNTRDIVGGRIALLQNFSDDWRATLTAYYQRQQYQGSWQEEPAAHGPLNLELYSPQGGYNYDHFVDLRVEGDVGIGDLVYAGGYIESQVRRLYDYSEYAQYSPYAPFINALACATDPVNGSGYSGCKVPTMYGQVDYDFTRWSNEVRLQSKAGGRAHWTVGAYWEKTQLPYSGFQHMPAINFSSQAAVAYINQYGNVATPLPEEYYSDFATYEYLQTTEFGDITFDVSDRWSIEAGLEHFHSDSSEVTYWAGYFYNAKTPVLRTSSATKTNLKAGVNFKPADRTLLYLSFAQGFRDGGFNYVGPDTDPSIPRDFAPDTLNNFEFGWKSDFRAGSITWNGALYYMPWKDYQVPVHIAAAPYEFQTNIGSARIYGVESSLEARPVAGLQISLAVNYDDATLVSNTWQSPTFVVVPGQRLAEAPACNARAAVRYEWPVGGGPRAFAQLDAARKGSMWNDLRLDHRVLQPGYTIGNLRLGLSQPHGTWQAEAYVTNVANTRAVVFANYNTFYTLGQYDIVTEPRVFGLRLSYRYSKGN